MNEPLLLLKGVPRERWVPCQHAYVYRRVCWAFLTHKGRVASHRLSALSLSLSLCLADPREAAHAAATNATAALATCNKRKLSRRTRALTSKSQ